MSALLDQRCLVHPDREAAVRCPSCRRFYCRECVIEHDGRMMCSRCVAQIVGAAERRGRSTALWSALAAGGFLFAWLVFYYLGMGLARTPSVFFGGAP